MIASLNTFQYFIEEQEEDFRRPSPCGALCRRGLTPIMLAYTTQVGRIVGLYNQPRQYANEIVTEATL